MTAVPQNPSRWSVRFIWSGEITVFERDFHLLEIQKIADI